MLMGFSGSCRVEIGSDIALFFQSKRAGTVVLGTYRFLTLDGCLYHGRIQLHRHSHRLILQLYLFDRGHGDRRVWICLKVLLFEDSVPRVLDD